MAKRNQVYKCELCGNIVSVLHGAAGELVCCKQPMVLFTENTFDAAKEKHVPVIERTDSGHKVTVGSVLHPMETEHYIEWIELHADSKVYIQFLNLGDEPAAEFAIQADKVTVRAYCNLHGLWKV